MSEVPLHTTASLPTVVLDRARDACVGPVVVGRVVHAVVVLESRRVWCMQ